MIDSPNGAPLHVDRHQRPPAPGQLADRPGRRQLEAGLRFNCRKDAQKFVSLALLIVMPLAREFLTDPRAQRLSTLLPQQGLASS